MKLRYKLLIENLDKDLELSRIQEKDIYTSSTQIQPGLCTNSFLKEDLSATPFDYYWDPVLTRYFEDPYFKVGNRNTILRHIEDLVVTKHIPELYQGPLHWNWWVSFDHFLFEDSARERFAAIEEVIIEAKSKVVSLWHKGLKEKFWENLFGNSTYNCEHLV